MASLDHGPPDPDPRISASTVGTFERCERLFALQYVFHIGNDGSEATRRGTAVHNLLEHWYQGLEINPWISPIHAIAVEALPFIPPRWAHSRGYVSTEREFTFHFAGVNWKGKKDLEFFPPNPERWELLDYKTTGDFKWSKSEDTLSTTDLQSNLYALETMYQAPGLSGHPVPLDSLRFTWIYLQTKQRRTTPRPVRGIITRKDAETTVKKHGANARKALALAQTIQDPFEATPNPRACGMFGGCQFRLVCNVSPDQESTLTMNAPQLTPEEFAARFRPATVAAPVALPAGVPPGSTPVDGMPGWYLTPANTYVDATAAAPQPAATQVAGPMVNQPGAPVQGAPGYVYGPDGRGYVPTPGAPPLPASAPAPGFPPGYDTVNRPNPPANLPEPPPEAPTPEAPPAPAKRTRKSAATPVGTPALAPPEYRTDTPPTEAPQEGSKIAFHLRNISRHAEALARLFEVE